MPEHFSLIATVSTNNPDAVRSVLQDLISKNSGVLRESGMEFQIETELDGETARELNRILLSSLRKVEKRTRLRAQWQHENQVEHFFDYGLKRVTTAEENN